MAEKKAATRFPGESGEYRRARNRLLQSEIKLRRQIEAVAEQRRKLPLGGVVKTDYVFDSAEPGEGAIKAGWPFQLLAPGQPTPFFYHLIFPPAPRKGSPRPAC